MTPDNNVGHKKGAESLQVPSKPILYRYEYQLVILRTHLNMLLLWLLYPLFQDIFSFPAFRALPRHILGKSSLCWWFLIIEKAGARFVWKGSSST